MTRTVTEKQVEFMGELCTVVLDTSRGNGRVALQLEDSDGIPFCTPSVNLDDVELADDEILIKDYSELTGMVDALVSAGIVERTGRGVPSGFVTIEIFKLLIS